MRDFVVYGKTLLLTVFDASVIGWLLDYFYTVDDLLAPAPEEIATTVAELNEKTAGALQNFLRRVIAQSRVPRIG